MKMYVIMAKFYIVIIIEYTVKGEVLSHDRLPPKSYIIIHVCAQLRWPKERLRYTIVLLDHYSTKYYLRQATPYIVVQRLFNRKRLVFRLSSTPKRLLEQMLNGVYA